jgi:hypothetical protein
MVDMDGREDDAGESARCIVDASRDGNDPQARRATGDRLADLGPERGVVAMTDEILAIGIARAGRLLAQGIDDPRALRVEDEDAVDVPIAGCVVLQDRLEMRQGPGPRMLQFQLEGDAIEQVPDLGDHLIHLLGHRRRQVGVAGDGLAQFLIPRSPRQPDIHRQQRQADEHDEECRDAHGAMLSRSRRGAIPMHAGGFVDQTTPLNVVHQPGWRASPSDVSFPSSIQTFAGPTRGLHARST